MSLRKITRIAGPVLMMIAAVTNTAALSCLWYIGSEKMPQNMAKHR